MEAAMRKVIPIIFVTAMTLDCAAHADGLTATQHLKNPLTDDVSLAQLAGSAAGMSGSSVLSMLLSDSPSLRLFAGATTTGKVGAVVVAITVDNPAKSGTISL